MLLFSLIGKKEEETNSNTREYSYNVEQKCSKKLFLLFILHVEICNYFMINSLIVGVAICACMKAACDANSFFFVLSTVSEEQFCIICHKEKQWFLFKSSKNYVFWFRE